MITARVGFEDRGSSSASREELRNGVRAGLERALLCVQTYPVQERKQKSSAWILIFNQKPDSTKRPQQYNRSSAESSGDPGINTEYGRRNKFGRIKYGSVIPNANGQRSLRTHRRTHKTNSVVRQQEGRAENDKATSESTPRDFIGYPLKVC